MTDREEGPRIETPDPVRWIVRTLERAGHETWTVGGAVRDALLGSPSSDWDFATRARPGQVRATFRRTVPIGIDHGTIGVLDRDGTLHEVTTFRKDVETDGRHAVVSFADRIEDDLARRDFTINAIAWHPLEERLFDPFGGEEDLRIGRLRTVGEPAERFREDYLRVLRALRFAGRLDLEIAPGTWSALVAATEGLGGLSAERIREEWIKVLRSEDPSRSLHLYREAGVLDRVAPALAAVPEARWEAALRRTAAIRPHRPILRTAALFEVALADMERDRAVGGVATWLEGLRFSNAEIDRTTRLLATRGPLPAAAPEGASDADLRRWLSGVGRDLVPDRIRLEIAAARSGVVGSDEVRRRVRRIREMLDRDPPLAVGDLAIGGRELIRAGLRPGPRFGRILDRLLDLVLEDPELNREELLLEKVAEWTELDR